jgi:hypothetical protein
MTGATQIQKQSALEVIKEYVRNSLKILKAVSDQVKSGDIRELSTFVKQCMVELTKEDEQQCIRAEKAEKSINLKRHFCAQRWRRGGACSPSQRRTGHANSRAISSSSSCVSLI